MALAIPVEATAAPGQTITSSLWNTGVRDGVNFLVNVPILNAVQAAVQSVANNAWTSLALDSTVVDSYGMHSNSVNNSRGTAQVAGWYLAFAASSWVSAAGTSRGARITKNGAAIAGGAVVIPPTAAGTYAVASPAVITFLNVGDYVEAQGFQQSGGALSTSVNADADCSLTAVWLHS
jgi:hypothetical protein